jgi:hypothetical protein
LNDLLGGKEAGEDETIANLPKNRSGKARARTREPSGRTFPKQPHLERETGRKPISVSEANQLNARDVRARTTDLDEEATHRQLVRRATPTEADKPQLRAMQLQNAFLPPNA